MLDRPGSTGWLSLAAARKMIAAGAVGVAGISTLRWRLTSRLQ